MLASIPLTQISTLSRTTLVLALGAFALPADSGAQVGPLAPPSVNSPVDASKLRSPAPGVAIPFGALTVTKAEARVFPGGVIWVPAGKVGVDVAYCFRNTSESIVNGPIYVKFYWSGIGDSNSVPSVPGMQGSVFGSMTPSLPAKSEQCGNIKLTFDPPAFSQIAPLKKAPKLRAWVPFYIVGNAASPAPHVVYSNNPLDVTVIPAAPK